MPLFNPPTPKPERVNLQVRVQKSLLELVELYAEFVGASREYVVTESVNRLLKRDHDFQGWLRQQNHSPSEKRLSSTFPTAPAKAEITSLILFSFVRHFGRKWLGALRFRRKAGFPVVPVPIGISRKWRALGDDFRTLALASDPAVSVRLVTRDRRLQSAGIQTIW